MVVIREVDVIDISDDDLAPAKGPVGVGVKRPAEKAPVGDFDEDADDETEDFTPKASDPDVTLDEHDWDDDDTGDGPGDGDASDEDEEDREE